MSDPKKNYRPPPCPVSRKPPNTHYNQQKKSSSRPPSPRRPSPQRQSSPQKQSYSQRQSSPQRQSNPRKQSSPSNRPIATKANVSRRSSPARKPSPNKIKPKINCPKIEPCDKASTFPDEEGALKNVKFINRNDILVYVDNENCNEDSLEKMFTIITTTEEEWAILKKLFRNKQSNYENSRDVKYRKPTMYEHRKYDDEDDDEDKDDDDKNDDDDDDCDESNIDNHSNKTSVSEPDYNCNDDGDGDLRSDRMTSSSHNSNDRSSHKCDESLNTVIEKELNNIDYTKTTKPPKCTEDKTCYYCSKDFITRNKLLASGKCPEIKRKDCAQDKTAYNKCNRDKPPDCNENAKRPNSPITKCAKDPDPCKQKPVMPEIKKEVLPSKCPAENKPKTNADLDKPKANADFDKPKTNANANLHRKSSPYVQKPQKLSSNGTFGMKRKTSLVPPDPPERPLYFAYKPRTFGLSRSFSNDGSFTCNSSRPMQGPHCNKRNETTYQRDYKHPPRSNSHTSNINFNSENFNYNNQYQYPSTEYLQPQRNFVNTSCPIRVKALNLRNYADPYYQSVPTVPFTAPYM